MGTKVRILSEVPVDGVSYQPNQVVDLPAAVAKSLEKAGVVDSTNEAVAYCLDQLGVTLIVHQAVTAKPAVEPEQSPATEPVQQSLQDTSQPG